MNQRNLHPIVAERQSELAALCRQHHVRRLELFGSGTSDRFDSERSDLDFIVEFGPEASAVSWGTFFDLKEALEKLFGREVDLISAGPFKNPYFAESVNETRVTVYAAPGLLPHSGQGPARRSAKRGAPPMTPPRESRKYLWDALQRADGALRMTASRTFADYLSDEMLRLAVERLLETMVEALSQLSHHDPDTAEQVPELRKIIGFRNVLAHGYEDLDHQKVWDSVQDDLPTLRRALAQLLGEEEGW